MLSLTQRLLEERLRSLLEDVSRHFKACAYCWNISELSSSHRLARLAALTPLMKP